MAKGPEMGALITRLREEKHLTQAQLASALGVGEKVVAQWERGGKYPDIMILTALAGQLGISVEELLAGDCARQQESPETLVASAVAYAGQVTGEMRDKVATAFLIAVVAICGVGMFVCGLVDLALNGSVTWSVYPISALVFALVVIGLPLFVKKYRIFTFLAALTVCLPPFLYVVLWRVGLSILFFSLAVPVTVLSLIYMWGIYLVAAYTKVNGWLKASAIIGLSPLLSFGVNQVVGAALDLNRVNAWDAFTAVSELALAGVLLIIGLRWSRRR